MSAPTAVYPRFRVDGPPPPLPHKYGLFSAATVLENVAGPALSGVEYEAVCSTQVDPYPAPCEPTVPDDTSHSKVAGLTTVLVEATPFGLYSADACILGRDEQSVRTALRRRFGAGEQAAVERLVATGALGNSPNLGREATVLDGTLDLADAIGELEQWLSTTHGGTGVFHAPRTLAPRAAAAMQVQTSGPRAETLLGSAWAFGAGYSGAGPDGQDDDGAVWLYATPPVTVRRSAVLEPASLHTGAFDIPTNSGFLLVERTYVVDWPCTAAAMKTTLTRPGYSSS